MSPTTKKSIGGSAILIIAIVAVIVMYEFVASANRPGMAKELGLPILAIAGVVVLLVFLSLVSIAFAIFDLSDKSQALALPEGSIRAVIALSLIILFSILSIFLYSTLSAGQLKSLDNLTGRQRDDFIKATPVNQIILITTNLQGTDERFTVYLRNNTQASEDFAKQVLVLIGTLVTAVSSFYFGTRAVAATPPIDAARPSPKLRAMSPNAMNVGAANASFTISGDNLDLIKEVKIAQGANQLLAANTTSNASIIKGELTLPTTTPAGAWDVIATDGTGKQAKLSAGFTVT